jgi:ADP-ribose pyrophosphatase YjhB (NUDIX family)
VWYRERRIDAARRKLREECGLEVDTFEEWSTHDVLFENAPDAVHGITTLFRARVASKRVTIDRQSERFEWRRPRAWLAAVEHQMLREVIERVARET